MKLTPAMRWRANVEAQRKLREQEALSNSPQDRRAADCDLAIDVKYLREGFELIEQRIGHKRTVLLPKWLPQVESYVAAGDNYAFPALGYCIIWLFDTGEFDRALSLADLAISQGQPMPENFASSLPAFVADTVREWADSEYEQGRSVEPYFSRVFPKVTSEWNLHEEIRAKWFVLAARLALRGEDGKQAAPSAFTRVAPLNTAAEHLNNAMALTKKSGARTLLNKIGARLRVLTRDLPTAPAQAGAVEGATREDMPAMETGQPAPSSDDAED